MNRKDLNKRTKKLSELETIRRRYSRQHDFPHPRIESQLASRPFAELVKEVWESIDLTEPDLLPEDVIAFLKTVRSQGATVARKDFFSKHRYRRLSQNDLLHLNVEPANYVGTVLMNRLIERKPEVFPINDIELHFRDNEIIICLSSMLVRQTEDGYPIFYSRKHLTVRVGHRDYILAFSPHAIKRICERFKPSFQTYLGLGDAHALFSYLNYVEVLKLPNGQDAVAIFDQCTTPGCWEYEKYVRMCMPEAPERDVFTWRKDYRPYGYRVGYCPIVLNGAYAVATTFLSPGYSGTPEGDLILNLVKDEQQRMKMIEGARNFDYKSLRYGNALQLVKWFHDNGVPQVIDPPIPLFDKEYLERKLGMRK